jgi:hypothetical protein
MRRGRRTLSRGIMISALGLMAAVAVNPAEPRPRQANWDNLKQLAAGDEIRLVLKDVKSYSAKFQSSTDDAIVVRLAGADCTFSRQDVLRVSTKGQSHRLRNAALGAAIGVGSGAILAASTSRNDSEAQAIGWVVIPPVTGVAGAGVGAFLPTGGWHDVYRAR